MKSIFFVLLFFIFTIMVSGCSSKISSEDIEKHEEAKEEFHIHADFKVYIDDKAINFSFPMYQLRDKFVHVEDGVGDVAHVHKRGITIGNFFKTLGINFNKTCITIPLEGVYCNKEGKRLSFYVNKIENDKFEDYEIKDKDKILISYGTGDIKRQLETVTDLASTRQVENE